MYESFTTLLDRHYTTIENTILYGKIVEKHTQSYPAEVLNEYRAFIFHVFEMTRGEEEKHVIEAEGHLLRAAFDVCNLVSSIYIKSISEIVNRYKVGTIDTIFKKYHEKIRPRVVNIQRAIDTMSKERDTLPVDAPDRITNFWTLLIYLMQSHSELEAMNPRFIAYELEQEQAARETQSAQWENKRKEMWVRAAIAGGSVLITFLLTYFFLNN